MVVYLGPRIYGNTHIPGPYFDEPHLEYSVSKRGKRRASNIIINVAHGSEEFDFVRAFVCRGKDLCPRVLGR